MKNEWKDKQAGNGLNQYSKIDAAAFPKSTARKASFASALCDKPLRTPNQCSARWPQGTKHGLAGRSSFHKTPSFQDDSSEGEFQRVGRESPDYTSSVLKTTTREEDYSTASSFGGFKPSNYKSEQPIDNFKVVVLGDEFDGIKNKGLPNNRFAAACLFKPPEANELKLPDF